MAGGQIEITALSKWYGEQRVLNEVDLDIAAGEFFSLLGPSGCGKTTTLRLLGGFEPIEYGIIRIDGVEQFYNWTDDFHEDTPLALSGAAYTAAKAILDAELAKAE